MARFLSTGAARDFYDRFGAKQDAQGFYEDPALDRLVAAGLFGSARRVFEFGCGTGRLAERLLADALPDAARYAGCDLSTTMIDLARKRLARFAPRTNLWVNDGGMDFTPGAPPFDRIVSTYVLDLLPPAAVVEFLTAAAATLTPGGLLCVVSLTNGRTPLSAATSAVWSLIQRLRPALVGGCRPMRLGPMLDPDIWAIQHNSQIAAWTIPSEITVASRR